MSMPYRVSAFRRSRVLRGVTALVIAGQIVSGAPLFAQEAARATVKASQKIAADAQRKIAKARVRVNRTVPKVTAPSLEIAFGAHVTTEALSRVRVFGEPMLPTAPPSDDDNRALAGLLQSIAGTELPHRLLRIEQFLADHPGTPWRASLLANAATFFAREGYFSRAAAYWEHAWELTRDSIDPNTKAIADYALGESMTQMATFGQVPRMQRRLTEIASRDVRGAAGAKVDAARTALFLLTEHHDLAIYSGPMALKMYLAAAQTATVAQSLETIEAYHAPLEGTSLTALKALATSAGLELEMVHAAPIGEIPVPSVVHLRSQHFSAIVGKEGDRYLVRDPSLGGTMRLSEDALRDESTGYFLVGSAQAKEGSWRLVSDSEANAVVGHCFAGTPSKDDPPDYPCGGKGPGGTPNGRRPGDSEPGGGPAMGGGGGGGGGRGGRGGGDDPDPCQGMPYYFFHPVSASLIVEDTPLGYAAPIGPPVQLSLSYNHRDGRQPQTMTYGNVGPLWTFNALSWVNDNFYYITPPYTDATVVLRGQGKEAYLDVPGTHPLSLARLEKVSHDPPRYERHLPDGSIEVFTQPDRPASELHRKTYLTEVIDPQGHSLTYTYDSSLRMVAITDAIGQVTTLEYLDSANPLRITKVTDPFGRYATITYDAAGRIQSLTDVANMTSSFAYGASDFITAMTTPYGTTTFRHEAPGQALRIEATDPAGGTERLEFHFQNNALAETESTVPTGFSASNASLHMYNSLYWDKAAMGQYPGDITKAVITGWMFGYDSGEHHPTSRNVPHSIKRPLENRVWYRYADQGTGRSVVNGRQPALIGRVLDGGASQITQITYNSKGYVTSVIDPLGRQTSYTYATNGIDVLQVEQVRSGGTDALAVFADYTSQHLPETITDAAGQDTTVTYNSAGQPLTVTNAKSETTTFAYDTDGYLQTVTGPVSGATTTFTYDAYGRVDSVEGSDGYLVALAYDNLDRLTSRTFPDETTETLTYQRLDVTEVKDRLGRISRYVYDRYGRLIASRDPADRTVSYVWCSCDWLDALIDAKGQRTSWERSLDGRVTREIRADGTTDRHYTYDLAGRLKTITDPMDQVTTYTYNVDNSLASTGFTNETIATPDLSHTYDTYYPRPATMVDGNGTTTYSYVAPGTNGAGQLASVDGPFSNDTITYTYDELGRVLTRMLNGTGTEITYDTLGRLSQLEFPIGTFDYAYVGHTGRRSTVTYPNDQTTTYSYLDDEHDFRLQTIHHKNPSAATLSKFDYAYDLVGNILTWRQERAGSAAKIYTFTHDLVDQVTSAVLTDTNSTPTILKRQAWAYDAAGNRTVDQADDTVFAASHDSLNRLQSRAPGGPIVFAGSLNEPGTVTIDGQPATVDAANNFRGTAQLAAGTTTVTVKAKDGSGNETTQQYEVETSGSMTSYSYDANGNLTADSAKTYFWNALNQLVEVKQGSTTLATFEYDGEGRRMEKVAAGVTHTYIYDAEDIAEERLSGSTTDTIRFYHGARIDEPLARKNSSDVVIYYLADHLGSVVLETSSAGAVTLQREYDPWGVLVQGDGASGYSFTGREWDSETDLAYYRARYYDPRNGRFLGEDALGVGGGDTNFFAYVRGRPLSATDPSGLEIYPKGVPPLPGPTGILPSLVIAAPLVYATSLLPAAMTAAEIAAGGGGLVASRSSGIPALLRRLAEHEAKLEAYIRDPDANDNLGKLKNVSDAVREKIVNGRIEKLRSAIEMFRREIEKRGGSCPK